MTTLLKILQSKKTGDKSLLTKAPKTRKPVDDNASVEDEFRFARKLVALTLSQRNKGIKNLTGWLSRKPNVGELEFKKVWKALYYCFWLSDKPLPQLDLAINISQQINLLVPEKAALWVKVFFDTMNREWHLLDHYRLDKYYLLIRKVINQMFKYYRDRRWNGDVISQFNKSLTQSALKDDPSVSAVQLQIIQVYIEELYLHTKEITKQIAQNVFKPFFDLLAYGSNLNTRKEILQHVFLPLLSDLAPPLQEEEEQEDPDRNFFLTDFDGFAEVILDIASSHEIPDEHRGLLYSLRKRFLVAAKQRRSNKFISEKTTEVEQDLSEGKLPESSSLPENVDGLLPVAQKKREKSRKLRQKKKLTLQQLKKEMQQKSASSENNEHQQQTNEVTMEENNEQSNNAVVEKESTTTTPPPAKKQKKQKSPQTQKEEEKPIVEEPTTTTNTTSTTTTATTTATAESEPTFVAPQFSWDPIGKSSLFQSPTNTKTLNSNSTASPSKATTPRSNEGLKAFGFGVDSNTNTTTNTTTTTATTQQTPQHSSTTSISTTTPSNSSKPSSEESKTPKNVRFSKNHRVQEYHPTDPVPLSSSSDALKLPSPPILKRKAPTSETHHHQSPKNSSSPSSNNSSNNTSSSQKKQKTK